MRGALVIALVLAGVAGGTATAESPAIESYVALGDSYTSGPGIPQPVGEPVGCGRSTNNYPHLVAAELGVVDFTDVSCSGAVIPNLSEAQDTAGGLNPPQLAALQPRTDLVTLGISGNDVGFGAIVAICAQLGLVKPFGAPCKRQFTADGIDQLAERIADVGPVLGTALDDIRLRAPGARVLVVGYPVILPDDGDGCWPAVPIAAGDLPYLRDTEKALNEMIEKQAADHGAEYVDTYTSSVGHDVCKRKGTKWVEGLLPSSPAAPVHPNTLGMQNTAHEVVRVVLGS